MIPALTTPVQGPLADLERRILDSSVTIEHWFRSEWQEHTPPFYSSVDLRNSGFKLAPVDTNLFPGGFNNLNPQFLPLAVQAAMTAIERICPDARRTPSRPPWTRTSKSSRESAMGLTMQMRDRGRAGGRRTLVCGL